MLVGAHDWEEARRLGHHWVGEEHVLLALSNSASVAGEALRAAGATPDAVEAVLVHSHETADRPVESRSVESPEPTPAHYALFGRADGLALAAGRERPELEDILVALVWREAYASWLLHRMGVDRGELLTRLREAGVSVPPGEPEPLDLRPLQRVDVPYEHLRTIVGRLPGRLPPGSHFGFNFHPETSRAWIFVEEEIDGQGLVTAVLAGDRNK